jgi:hypothetical protein
VLGGVVVDEDGGELLVVETVTEEVELEASATVRIAFAKRDTKINERVCILSVENDFW